MPPANFSDYVQRYLAGEPAQKLGKELLVKGDTFTRWLRQAGIKPRTKAERSVLRRVSIPDGTVERYLAGESEKQIADSLGIDRNSLRPYLLRAGVQIRGRSEAESLKWSRMSQERRAAQVKAAHEQRRGQTDPLEVKLKRAATWQARLMHCSPREHALAAALRCLEIPVTQQAQVGPYNVDLALDRLPVAVEIEAGNWGFPRTESQYRERLKYILDQGWAVLFIYIHNRKPVYPDITDKVVAWLDLCRRDETTRGKYGMVRGDGKVTSTVSMKLDDFPRVVGF